MSSKEAIKERLEELIEQGNWLRVGEDNGRVSSDDQLQRCHGWITSVRHLVSLLFPDGDSIYRKHIEEVAGQDWERRLNFAVGEIAAVLSNLVADLKSGLLISIVEQTRVEVFDDFLDHARHCLAQNQKNQAGVIAGVVFEDTLRRIARNKGVEEVGIKLDQVISSLVQEGAISGAAAKRARASAHVRTKATHAQWDEFDAGDVEATIALTDELILRHMSV